MTKEKRNNEEDVFSGMNPYVSILLILLSSSLIAFIVFSIVIVLIC